MSIRICKDGRIWGQNNKEAGKHLGVSLRIRKPSYAKKGHNPKSIGKPFKKGDCVGEKNPNWKGGISNITDRIHGSVKYVQWRQDCFIRDNFTCQKCGNNTSGNLEVHHKKSVGELLQEVKKYLPLFDLYEGAMIYPLLWNLSNGITLCKECHKKIHNRGKSNKN